MLALIWTDMTANYITSTRGQLNAKFNSVTTFVQRAAQQIPSSTSVKVQAYHQVVQYHVPYAIVAIIFLVLYLAVLLAALGMCISRRSTLHLLRSLLNQTSVGRAVTVERYAKDGGLGLQARVAETSKWVEKFGDEDIGVVKERKRGQGKKPSTPKPEQDYELVLVQDESSPDANKTR